MKPGALERAKDQQQTIKSRKRKPEKSNRIKYLNKHSPRSSIRTRNIPVAHRQTQSLIRQQRRRATRTKVMKEKMYFNGLLLLALHTKIRVSCWEKYKSFVVNAKAQTLAHRIAWSTSKKKRERERKKEKKCPANYFKFFVFATYLRCLSLLFGKTFVYLFHSRHNARRYLRFLCLLHPFLAYCNSSAKKRWMQIKFIYYAFLFIWCILCFFLFFFYGLSLHPNAHYFFYSTLLTIPIRIEQLRPNATIQWSLSNAQTTVDETISIFPSRINIAISAMGDIFDFQRFSCHFISTVPKYTHTYKHLKFEVHQRAIKSKHT